MSSVMSSRQNIDDARKGQLLLKPNENEFANHQLHLKSSLSLLPRPSSARFDVVSTRYASITSKSPTITITIIHHSKERFTIIQIVI